MTKKVSNIEVVQLSGSVCSSALNLGHKNTNKSVKVL